MKVSVIKSWEDKDVSEDPKYIRDAAAVYKELEDSIAAIKREQAVLEPLLIKEKVNEYFDDGTKVAYQEGRSKNQLDEHKIIAELTYDELIRVTKIQEKDLKALSRPDDPAFGEKLLIANKRKISEGSPSIRVSKMTKQELKEHGLA